MNNKDVYANLDQLIDQLNLTQLDKVYRQVVTVQPSHDETWVAQRSAMEAGSLNDRKQDRFFHSNALMMAFDTGPN